MRIIHEIQQGLLEQGMAWLQVRKATQDDSAGILALDHLALTDNDRVQFINGAVASGSCFLALLSGCPAGYGILNYSFFYCGFIHMLYVAQTMRRNGIGGALINEMEACCATRKLFTSTNESNAAMQSLLLGRGYVRSGKVENLDEGDPEIIFFKELNAQTERISRD